MSGSRVLAVSGLSKTFPGGRVLHDVALDLRAGEVHALVGHNGSGKSTLIKILSGYHDCDPGGRAWLGDDEVPLQALGRPDESGRAPVAFVHQDTSLILELSAIENFALHRGFGRSSSLAAASDKRIRAETAAVLAELAPSVDPELPVSRSAPVDRTMIAIAIAVESLPPEGGVLVLDEPTASLPHSDVVKLQALIRQLTAKGRAILYVSHRLEEIIELGDRVTVLRNGVRVITDDIAGMGKADLVRHMLGDEAKLAGRRAPSGEIGRSSSPPALEVRQLTGSIASEVSFRLGRGEVLGVCGLPGSGASEVCALLTGNRAGARSGSVKVSGGAWVPATSRRLGESIALVPADRVHKSAIGPMTIRENLTISSLRRFGRLLLRRKAERRFTDRWLNVLGVVGPKGDNSIQTLSGGNQQKVMIGRVLGRDTDVLVVSEPTAGVDVGAKAAIYTLLDEHVSQGLSVIVESSDTDDLVSLCDRVLIFRRGVVAAELSADEISEQRLINEM
ncbi:sugar ABC transporter ATP-binding protein [Pseudonocardia ailaonensis]|uniref:Sugar ABC transporter ATP-binding protein n=1 Tax=Pseudonocardia ailaonensis TaxID=367279 RepID=A0ABN2N5E1_9PSEU